MGADSVKQVAGKVDAAGHVLVRASAGRLRCSVIVCVGGRCRRGTGHEIVRGGLQGDFAERRRGRRVGVDVAYVLG